MDHNDIRHKLSEYLDGSVSTQEKILIEEHLKTCTECSQALLELQKTIELVQNVEEVQPPDWMAQKIMATVRAEAEKKKSFIQRLFSPLSIKLPIQAVAVAFLTITAMYLYRGAQPMAPLPETPAVAPTLQADKELPASSALDRESGSSSVPAAPAKKRKAPDSKTMDSNIVTRQAAPAPAPSEQADRLAPEKKESLMEKRPAASSPLDTMEAVKRSAPAASALQRAKTKSESRASSQKAEELVRSAEPAPGLVKNVVERHANGKPRLVITYAMIDSQMRKRVEERFNADGEREGIQKEYYASGQLKTEAQYEKNRLAWYQEYGPDGVKKTSASVYDWLWLKN